MCVRMHVCVCATLQVYVFVHVFVSICAWMFALFGWSLLTKKMVLKILFYWFTVNEPNMSLNAAWMQYSVKFLWRGNNRQNLNLLIFKLYKQDTQQTSNNKRMDTYLWVWKWHSFCTLPALTEETELCLLWYCRLTWSAWSGQPTSTYSRWWWLAAWPGNTTSTPTLRYACFNSLTIQFAVCS